MDHRRRLLHLRDMVDRALQDINNGGPRLVIIRRLFWNGLPEDAALRIFAGRT